MEASVRIENIELSEASLLCVNEGALLEDANLKIPESSVVRISGQIGSGKSQLLRLFGGLMPLTSGEYLINSVPVSEFSFEEFMAYRLKIGYSFSLGGLINNKTLRENLLLQSQYHPKLVPEGTAAYTEELIDLFGLRDFENARPFYVPGSLRKTTIVVRSLLLKPDLLLLDDPTTGLSPENKKVLKTLLIDMRAAGFYKNIILASSDQAFMKDFVTHELNMVNRKIEISDLSLKVVSA